jgi:hypothetical protein
MNQPNLLGFWNFQEVQIVEKATSLVYKNTVSLYDKAFLSTPVEAFLI